MSPDGPDDAGSGGGLQLLCVVEDNDEDFVALRRALRGTRAGRRMLRFRTGEEALEHLAGTSGPGLWPVLVLLDLNLPGCGGLEVLAGLKSNPVTRVVPVVVVSGSARQEDVDAAYRRGANAYLVKALDFDELRRGLRALEEFWFRVARPTRPPHPGGRRAP